jgi:hypothetical protein
MTAHPRTCHRCTSRLHPALKHGNCLLQRGLAAVDVSASVGGYRNQVPVDGAEYNPPSQEFTNLLRWQEFTTREAPAF